MPRSLLSRPTILLACLLAVITGAAVPTLGDEPSAAATAQDAQQGTADQRQRVSVIIRRHFPNIDADTLAGWIDTYLEVPTTELNELLLQKKNMQTLLPGFPDDSESVFPNAVPSSRSTPASVFQQHLNTCRRMVRNNLLHLETPGYRRRILRTQLAELSPKDESSNIQLAAPTYSFIKGRDLATGELYHLSIVAPANAFFRLEPGSFLTRCGTFERLDNGLLGQRCGSQQLTLFGDIQVPADQGLVKISMDGDVRIETQRTAERSFDAQRIQKIQLATVPSLGRMTSGNSVYFQLPEDETDHIQMTSAIRILPEHLELSNVIPDQEEQTLKRLHVLEGIAPDRRN